MLFTILTLAVGAVVGGFTFKEIKKRAKKKNNTPAIAGVATGVGSAVLLYALGWLLIPIGAAGGLIYYLRKKDQKALPAGED
jgi:glucose uptake protein GlcU